MKRRTFIKNTGIVSAGIATSNLVLEKNRKFKICLNPGAIGVEADLRQLIDYAIQNGFEAIVPGATEISEIDESILKNHLSKMKSNSISFGSPGLPMDFRKDAETFKKGLSVLANVSPALNKAGIRRMSTWIMPTHDSLTYIENMKQQSSRLKKIANILGHYDIQFGLEYVGPKTLMARDRYPFVSSMKECRELIGAIDESNVGFVLDSFHWYCAEETVADLLTLDHNEIVTVDLNDAIEGRDQNTQIDNERMLPGDSGVIDLKGFIKALKTIGYDGPVRAEPFNKKLNEMDDRVAVKKTAEAMMKAAIL